MKILLFGKNGQLGWELQRSIAPLGKLIALSSQSQEICGNLANLEGIATTIRATKPDVIVNASAYTAVDKAETDIESARLHNVQAPTVMADEAQQCGAILVHYSTDYVFDGFGNAAWLETDVPKPLNIYGGTKLEGENAIQASGCQHLILRTSWVYAPRGHNFIKTILSIAKERDSLNIINDQIGSPTGADLLADVTAHAVRTILKNTETAGLYHVAAKGETSWYDYARFIVGCAGQAMPDLKTTIDRINAIPSREYPTPAKRPLNSRLNTNKFESTFGLHLPYWQEGVARALTEILESH